MLKQDLKISIMRKKRRCSGVKWLSECAVGGGSGQLNYQSLVFFHIFPPFLLLSFAQKDRKSGCIKLPILVSFFPLFFFLLFFPRKIGDVSNARTKWESISSYLRFFFCLFLPSFALKDQMRVYIKLYTFVLIFFFFLFSLLSHKRIKWVSISSFTRIVTSSTKGPNECL